MCSWSVGFWAHAYHTCTYVYNFAKHVTFVFWICVVTKHHFPPGSATQFFQIPHHPSVFCRSGLLVFLIIIGFHLFLPLVACNHLSLQYYMQITREEATTTRVSMSSLIGLLPFAELGVGRSKSLAWQWVSWWPTGMIWHVLSNKKRPSLQVDQVRRPLPF